MAKSETESMAEIKDEDHVGKEEGSGKSEDDLAAGMGLQVLSGKIIDFDPEGDDARPFDIVAVHGLHGDRHNSWGGPTKNWLQDDLFTLFPSSRILTFGYDAHGLKGIFTRAGIREKAIQLLDELVKLRKPSEPVCGLSALPLNLLEREELTWCSKDLFRPLIFIAQDLGGIIVKEALCIAAFKYQKYRTVIKWARLFIFFSCPHQCTSTQNMEDSIGNLLYATQYPRPVGALRTISVMSRSIVEINGSFVLSKIPTIGRIVNVYSGESNAALQVFDRYTATFALPVEYSSIARQVPHKDICSTSAVDLGKFISAALQSYPKPSEYNKASELCLRSFQALAVPAYPFESKYGLDGPYSWLSDHDTYKSWFESHGPGLLHIHGTTGTSDAAEYLFQHLNACKTAAEPLLYFKFDKYDDRRNSVIGMLNSLHAQLFSHRPVYHGASILSEEQMVFYHSWTTSENYSIFRNFCKNLSHDGCYIVINGLDQCDESMLVFLKSLSDLASATEYKFKVVLTSSTKSSIQSALAKWPMISLKDYLPATLHENDEVLASEVQLEVLHLVQRVPALYDFETSIIKKLLECGQDKDWRRLVLKEFQNIDLGSSKTSIQDKLDGMLVSSPRETFQRILSRITSERQAWAKRTLSWIIYSFRPLSVWELAIALSQEVDSFTSTEVDSALIYETFTSDLDDVFGGSIIIKHNQVLFGHPHVREFFTELDLHPDTHRFAHRDILDTCYNYLSSKQVQDYLVALYASSAEELVELPIFTHGYNLIEYAVKYWPKHFNSISENLPSIHDLEFVHNAKVMRVWAEAYWCLSNPVYRRDRSFLSLLPVFAGLGLQSLLKEWLTVDVKSPGASRDRGLALVEATRYGQTEIVRLLLNYQDYNEAGLRDALCAATASEDEPVLDELVTYIRKTIEKFDWPPTTVLRATQFGHVKIVRRLLEFGASPDTGIEMHDMHDMHDTTPLYGATRDGKAEVVKILLEYGARVNAKSLLQRTALHAACSGGHADIVKLLVHAGSNINEMDNNNDTPMCLAVQWGNYKAVEVMNRQPIILDGPYDSQTTMAPMVIAASRGFIKCARVMLENNVNTEVDYARWTPLQYTIDSSNVEFTKLLLDNGADSNTTKGDVPPLAYAARMGNFEAIKLLVENGAKVDTSDSMGMTALHNAAENDHRDIITYLLDHGADINAQDVKGQTALLLAATECFSDSVKILLDKGADFSIASNENWSPIQNSYDSAETTRLLMEAGADANRATASYTPLYLAAIYNKIDVVKVLVSYPIDLEIAYKGDGYHNNYTALTIAVVNGFKEVARLLLEAGANVNHLSDENNFCLQYAIGLDDTDLVRTLMEYNPKLDLQDNEGDTAVGCIRESAPLEIYQMLVNGGASIEIPNNNLYTPICTAAGLGTRLDIVKYLISKNVNLNHISKYGGPLHIACRDANYELVKILIEAGADVDLVSNSMEGNPLQAVAVCWGDDSVRFKQEKVLRYLIDEGKADVNVVGGMQGCALNATCGWSSPAMVKLLLEKGARTDVVDEMGRSVIHFAARQSLENLQHIVGVGVDIDVRDLMGRNTLHWAVVSGSLDVVERVLSLSRRLLDQPDNDGWTPLLWAARGCTSAYRETSTAAREKIVRLLLDHGANPLVKGRGLDREWTPIKVARYHNLDNDTINLFINKTKEKLGKEDLYKETEHASLKASESRRICDSCFCRMLGNRYHCNDCSDLDFCYKCYNSRLIMHNKDHTFEIIGPEFEPVIEPEKKSTKADADDTDDDSVDDTDKDEDEEKKDNSEEIKKADIEISKVAEEEEEDSDDSDSN